MSENPRQPRPDDAVLGGQSQAPMYAAVLGGIEGVKLRLETGNLEEKKAALQDALKYGEKGIEVLFEVLEQEESYDLQWLAYGLLENEAQEFKYVTKKTKVNKEIELSLWDKLRGKSNIEEVELEIVEKEDSYSRLNQQIKLNIKARLEKLFSWYGFESVTVNRRGEIIKRTPGRAKYYRENLGKGVYLDMVYVAGGKFMMGSPLSEKDSRDRERPQHEVTVPSYWMGKYAVTQEQWEAVMGDNPSQFKGAKRPVESVSWTKCKEFCKKLSLKIGTTYRLPSEAEWEYGCRAGTTTAFHSGETITTDLANYRGTVIYAEEGMGLYRQETIEVGTFPPNNFGLYEMHGNVWEWCEDEWIERRVLRGGSWINYPYFCRSALRHGSNRADVSNCFGFRLVCLVGRTF